MSFEILSKYWAGPISNALLVLLALLILYPVIWKLSVSQMSAAFEALKTAKDLPAHLGRLTDASERLLSLNREIAALGEKLGQLDGIREKLEIANRQIADLQKASEERPPEPSTDAAPTTTEHADEVENWEQVSEMWFAVKDYVEAKIAAIWDGRIRRKYNSIPRYTYDEITEYMVRDELISREKADAIDAMNSAFRSLRNRKTPVTAERVDAFRQWRNLITANED